VMADPVAKVEHINVVPAVNDVTAAQPTPIRQYARSAVVIPFRSGAR
jgi:hypothetical protein